MTIPPKNGNGKSLSQIVLSIVLAGLWAFLAGAYIMLNNTVNHIQADVALVKGSVEELQGSVGRIEARLAAIDTSTAAAATDQRNRQAARIADLEALQQQRAQQDTSRTRPPAP